LLEDAQFELESARNRLLGLVTLYLEALIAASIIIPMYESSFDANARILVTIIVLAFLIPIGLFIAFNLLRPARRNARK
jgi:MFS-type transporter involved in bile tolerance (Atg22 family)